MLACVFAMSAAACISLRHISLLMTALLLAPEVFKHVACGRMTAAAAPCGICQGTLHGQQ